MAARNALLRRMVLEDQGQARLGIQQFPAEGGLTSVLAGGDQVIPEDS